MSITRISYSIEVLDLFQSEIERFGVIETGGALVGFIEGDTIYIEKACNGGPKAIHDNFYFRADPDYIDLFIDIEVANSESRLRYIGEWHTHPQIVPVPSNKDLNSLYEIAESGDDFCVLLIIGAVDYKIESFIKQSVSIIKFNALKQFYLLSLDE